MGIGEDPRALVLVDTWRGLEIDLAMPLFQFAQLRVCALLAWRGRHIHQS